MKVLLVIDHFGSGGAQRQLVYLATGLKRLGHQVECFVYYPEFSFFRAQLDGAGIAVHAVPKRGRLGIGVVAALRRQILQGRFDAVIAFMETPSIYAELAAMGLRSVRVLVSERVDPEPGPASPMLRLRAVLHRRAARIVTNSYTCMDDWNRRFPRLRRRMAVVWNGVDLAAFAELAAAARAVEVEVLLAVGTIVPRKNAHGIVAALAELRRRGRPVPAVWWLGKQDPTTTGRAYFAELNRQINENGLQDRWRWCGEHADVLPYYAKADALLHPSFREGLSNAVCEGLAAGLPVLAGEVGDNNRMVANDRGMLFDPRDTSSIADCIERFCALTEAERVRMQQSARRFAERELGVDRFVAEFETLLRDVTRIP